MDVNPPQHNNHLLQWASSEATRLGYQLGIYTLRAVVETGAFSLILRSIDQENLQGENLGNEGVEGLYRLMEGFLVRECGKKLRLPYRNRLMAQQSIGELLKLLLFCCIHSKDKQEYISRIFEMEEPAQSTLMNAIQEVNSNLLNVVNHNDLLMRVQQLQNEAEQLKSQLLRVSLKEQCSQKLAEQLQQQLKRKTHQIKQHKEQKQRVMEALQLPNFEQYLCSFRRLQQQNRILNRYVEELEDSLAEHEQSMKEMRRELEGQSIVIADLNDSITGLKDRIRQYMCQEACLRGSFEGAWDGNRSFGAELKLNGNKLNTNRKSLGGHKTIPKVKQSPSSNSNPTQNPHQREQQLMEQMRQLRKYNTDLIQKVEIVYKTLNNLTYETSQIKQKNEALEKENKFYRHQIKSLRKLQERMQSDLARGVI